MGRKKKIPTIVEEVENDEEQDDTELQQQSNTSLTLQGPMYTILSNVQMGETLHKKYIKEMKQLYEQMDHDAFMYTFIKLLKTPMEADETNEYAMATLTFCAKFVSSFDSEDTHPLLIDIFKWILNTISNNSHIRFRLCQFVNMILSALGAEAALDDRICDCILDYMIDRLRDTSPNVRLQAIYAMQRLQIPDNPDDPVLRAYQYHLCSDPSSKVRMAVITCMGRNFNTIPYILERLWDNDDKVRRHTYVHMSSYPVRSYKVAQRLTLLEKGLNDRSEAVRKVVSTIMLNQWIESYQKNLIALVSALKLDANESEIDHFRKITKQMLMEIFKKQSTDDLMNCLVLLEEGEFHRCIPLENLTIENAFYWECLTEYFCSVEAEELDFILPELSVMCHYVKTFCEEQYSESDKFEQLEFMFKLLSLTQILYTFDLSDLIGRNNLKELLSYLLKNFMLDRRVIEVIVKCTENLIEDQNERLQFFVDIIREICDLNPKSNDLLNDRKLLDELLANCSDDDFHLKISTLKVKFMDLEEQEANLLKEKNYVQAQIITEAKNNTREEFHQLIEKYSNQNDKVKKSINMNRPVTNETVLKCLQLTYHMIVSEKIRSLNAVAVQLYHDFICRHLASNQIIIRDWALKCGTAYSMLYEALSKDVFEVLYSQFFKNHNITLWETSISCIFELLDRYGVESFLENEDVNKTKKTATRQLYNTMESLEDEDDRSNSVAGQGVGVIYMMSHFLDTCDDIRIIRGIIIGFCRLILRGHITTSDVVEKLLLRYFNPSTEPEISQVLGIFMENIIEQRNYSILQASLLPTISTVLSAPYDSPFHEIKPETITRFFIDFTRQDLTHGDENMHNKIAFSFLKEMLDNVNNKELCKLLAKDLITLELKFNYCDDLKQEMKTIADKLIKFEFDPKTIKNIVNFKDLMDGNFNPPVQLAKDGNDTDHEEDEEDEDLNTLKDEDNNSERPTTAASMTPSETSEIVSLDSLRTLTEEVLINDLLQDSSLINKTLTSSDKIKTPTKTMYGEKNTPLHRSLRKSLNVSLGGSGERTPSRTKRSLMRTEPPPSTGKRSKTRKDDSSENPPKNPKNLDKDFVETSKTPGRRLRKTRVVIENIEIIKEAERKRLTLQPEEEASNKNKSVSEEENQSKDKEKEKEKEKEKDLETNPVKQSLQKSLVEEAKAAAKTPKKTRGRRKALRGPPTPSPSPEHSKEDEDEDDEDSIIPPTQSPLRDSSPKASNNNNLLPALNEKPDENSLNINNISGVLHLDISSENLDKSKTKNSPVKTAPTTRRKAARLASLKSPLKENLRKTPVRKRGKDLLSSKAEGGSNTPSKPEKNQDNNERKSFTSTPYVNKTQSPKSHQENQSSSEEAMNASDIIPASPQTNSDSQGSTSLRLRRAVLTNSTMRVGRSLRKRQNSATLDKTSSPQTKTKAKGKPGGAAATATEVPASSEEETTAKEETPIRNRRKRALRLSPPVKGSQSPSKSQESIVSPIRKQSRLSEETNSQANTNKNSNLNSNLNSNKNPSSLASVSSSAANSEVGSPSSLKENENPSNASKQTPKANKNPQKHNKSLQKSHQKRHHHSPHLNSSSASTPAVKSKVTTRNSARKEQRNQIIMTRKRLSLELNTSHNSSKIINPSPELQPERKKMKISKISKIPVINKKIIGGGSSNANSKESSSTNAAGNPNKNAVNFLARNSTGSNKTGSNGIIASKETGGNIHTRIIKPSVNSSLSNLTYSTITTSPRDSASDTNSALHQKSKIVIIASIDSNKKNPSRLPQPIFRKSRERN